MNTFSFLSSKKIVSPYLVTLVTKNTATLSKLSIIYINLGPPMGHFFTVRLIWSVAERSLVTFYLVMACLTFSYLDTI